MLYTDLVKVLLFSLLSHIIAIVTKNGPFQAFFILGGSLLSEGATLIMAVNAIRQGAAKLNMPFTKYSKYYSFLLLSLVFVFHWFLL